MAKQKGTKVSQPIALEPELRDTLERFRVIKPPTVPKIEVLEKYIKIRAWTYDVSTHNAGADPGTHVDLHVSGMAGEPVTHSDTAETLALALVQTICSALLNQPEQASFMDAKSDHAAGVVGPLFASSDEAKLNDVSPIFAAARKYIDESHVEFIKPDDHRMTGFTMRAGSPVARAHDPVTTALNAEATAELDRREAVALAMQAIPGYAHLAIDDGGVYFDEVTYAPFETETVERDYARAIADGDLPWTEHVRASAEDAIRDKTPQSDTKSPQRDDAPAPASAADAELYDPEMARIEGDAWLEGVAEEYGVAAEDAPGEPMLFTKTKKKPKAANAPAAEGVVFG